MGLVIKKRVSLDFLGEEYKDSVIVFRSIPAKDLPDIQKKAEGAGEDTGVLIPLFLSVLSDYFIEGTHEGKPIEKADINDLDATSVIECFQILTGQKIDPKDNGLLTSSSGTESEQAQT